MMSPRLWPINSAVPALERKVEDLFRPRDKFGCRFIILRSLSTLLSDGPTTRGFKISFGSCSLTMLKKKSKYCPFYKKSLQNIQYIYIYTLINTFVTFQKENLELLFLTPSSIDGVFSTSLLHSLLAALGKPLSSRNR